MYEVLIQNICQTTKFNLTLSFMKQQLIQYLIYEGKNKSWKELAKMFGFDCPEKARKAWLRYRKEHTISLEVEDEPVFKSYKPTFTTTAHTFVSPTSLEAQKEVLLTQLKARFKTDWDLARQYLDFKEIIDSHKGTTKDFLLELAVFDLHIGKLAIKEEVGEDYNIGEAVSRYKGAITKLMSMVDLDRVERILLPIGNDLFNIDNKRGTTTAGTPQDYDGRFSKIVSVTKELLISIINDLSTTCHVDIVIIPGNHDNQTTFMLGEILDAYYHNSPLVKVYNEPTQRKYYQYGNTSIQFTHGNEEKHQDLGLIFATEKPMMWAQSSYRFCQMGHYHKSKRLSYVSIDEFQGFQIQILPSLSGADAWHDSKGYKSLKQAKAFLFSRTEGVVAEYTYNV